MQLNCGLAIAISYTFLNVHMPSDTLVVSTWAQENTLQYSYLDVHGKIYFLFSKVPTAYFSVIKCLVEMSVMLHIEHLVVR